MTDVKVATVQFTVGMDEQENLAAMLDRIDEAADNGAQLVHFAEFCNRTLWFEDKEDAWQAALDTPTSPFLEALQAKARERGVYVSFNAIVKSDQQPATLDQSHLISPAGELIGTACKQVLMHMEKDFITPAPEASSVVDTPIGRIGMYICMDGLVPETSRLLGVKGAQVLLNSLSSNGIDEAHTHIPVRAAENRVWVVSANRSGPFVPESEKDALVSLTGIPWELLLGAGESQIVAPDGTPLARAPLRVDGIAYATIQPELADDKSWAGGGDAIRDRRPDAYGPLVTPNADLPYARPDRDDPAPELRVAAAQIAAGPDAVEKAVAAIRRAESEVVVLPELFPFTRERIAGDPAGAARESADALAALGAAAREAGAWVATSLVEADGDRFHNTAYLIGPEGGVAATYRQVHVHPDDRSWAAPGDSFSTLETPFGTVGLMVGYDGCFIESARVLARLGADLVVYPTTWRAEFEPELGVIERSAENHVSLVAAARPDSPVEAPSVVLALPGDYRFPTTGEVNIPDRHEADLGPGAIVRAVCDLTRSRDKLLMGRTDLIMDTRPDLYGPLVAT